MPSWKRTARSTLSRSTADNSPNRLPTRILLTVLIWLPSALWRFPLISTSASPGNSRSTFVVKGHHNHTVQDLVRKIVAEDRWQGESCLTSPPTVGSNATQ